MVHSSSCPASTDRIFRQKTRRFISSWQYVEPKSFNILKPSFFFCSIIFVLAEEPATWEIPQKISYLTVTEPSTAMRPQWLTIAMRRSGFTRRVLQARVQRDTEQSSQNGEESLVNRKVAETFGRLLIGQSSQLPWAPVQSWPRLRTLRSINSARIPLEIRRMQSEVADDEQEMTRSYGDRGRQKEREILCSISSSKLRLLVDCMGVSAFFVDRHRPRSRGEEKRSWAVSLLAV